MPSESILVQSERFGELTLRPEQALTFLSPVIGFEDLRRYALLDPDDETSPFQWLQSMEDESVAFVLTQPAWFGKEYAITIPQEVVTALEIGSANDVQIYTMVTIPDENPSALTANLMGPIIINVKNHQAMQIILEEFETRVRLLPDTVMLSQAKTDEEASPAAVKE